MRGVVRRWREWREAREEYRASMDEMQFHIEEETAHNIRNGMTPAAARSAALRAFGGVDRFVEAAHDERPGTKWSDFRMSYLDWKLGARMLVKHPGVSLLGVVTLAVAIGIGAGWFEMTMLLFRPDLPFEDGDRIVRVEYWDVGTQDPDHRTMHEFAQWRERLTTVEQLGAHRTVERNLSVPGAAPVLVQVAEISASAFGVTRVAPLLGRPLIAADEEPGSGDVVVIGFDAWQRHFDGDRTVVGREVQLGRVRATVVGVMPEDYRFPLSHQFWMPLRVAPVQLLEGGAIEVFGRLRTGASMASARAEVAAWGARMAQESPATHAQLRLRLLPFAASGEDSARVEVFFINLAAWLILIAACANVAALMFARTAMRESEITVRNALGASRTRIMGQLFTEALVLTSAASIVGLLGAHLAFRYVLDLLRGRGTPVPFWWEAGIEPETLLYTGVLAVAGAAMVGLLPALRATGRNMQARLAQIGSGGTSMRFGGVWSTIIVFQVAFSVVCLPFGLAAAFEARRETGLRAAFPADNYLTFRPVLDTELQGNGLDAADRADAVLAELARRVTAEPEVTRVAFAAALPGTYHPLQFQGSDGKGRVSRIEMQRGAEAPVLVDARTEGDRVRVGAVGPGFFETFDRPVVAGREFVAADIGAASRVVVINETLARNMGGNPVGARIRVAADGENEPGPWHEVVGVTSDFGLTPTGGGEADYLYTPVSAADAEYAVLHVNGDAGELVARLRTIAMAVDPSLRLHDVLTLREVIRRQDVSMIQATLMGIGVVLLAIILSAASLHALMSVAVAVRTREIGIRVAIGASSRAVLSSLFRRAATQVGVGIVVGNIAITMLLVAMTEEIQPGMVIPPMIVASVVMLLVGVAACLLPARRALRIQPTDAFREAR